MGVNVGRVQTTTTASNLSYSIERTLNRLDGHLDESISAITAGLLVVIRMASVLMLTPE